MADTLVSRRKYPRIPSKNAVLIKLLGDERCEGFVRTEVVGLGGCMFYSDQPFDTGSYLDVLIAVHATVVKALCKVVYQKDAPEGRFETGVEFVQISDTDRKLLETLWVDSTDLSKI